MLSQSRLKFLRSLQLSKYRTREKHFLAEGEKITIECLQGAHSKRFRPVEIFGESDWIEKNLRLIETAAISYTKVTRQQLDQISTQKTPNQAVTLLAYEDNLPATILSPGNFFLVLDRIQDPGNVGTIFRIAEWFGVQALILSPGTANPLNPKVIQSGMGSVLRMNFEHQELSGWLKNVPDDYPVYGTALEGRPIHTIEKPSQGIVLIGNESQGIDSDLERWIDTPVFIPRYPGDALYPESLNVAVATAIVLSAFRS